MTPEYNIRFNVFKKKKKKKRLETSEREDQPSSIRIRSLWLEYRMPSVIIRVNN